MAGRVAPEEGTLQEESFHSPSEEMGNEGPEEALQRDLARLLAQTRERVARMEPTVNIRTDDGAGDAIQIRALDDVHQSVRRALGIPGASRAGVTFVCLTAPAQATC